PDAKGDTVWKALHDYKDRVCIICSAGLLRRQGAAIARRLSWEQTIEDLTVELQLCDRLAFLSQFRFLVVRFGIGASALIARHDDHSTTIDLVFAPTAKAGIHHDPVEEGTLEGESAHLIVVLTRTLLSNPSNSRSALVGALKAGLKACMLRF